MTNPLLVAIDASVLAQWILPDEDPNPGTLRLVNDVHAERVVLIAPRLLRAELANVLSVSVRRGRISAENATLCLEAISGLNLVFADIDVLAVTRFSLLAGISVYDANYVVVAERHRCVLYTADQRMIRATRPYSDRVRPISDYGV